MAFAEKRSTGEEATRPGETRPGDCAARWRSRRLLRECDARSAALAALAHGIIYTGVAAAAERDRACHTKQQRL